MAMKKKEAIRFETEHPSGRELVYELDGTDKADAISIRVNTWGHAGIHVRTTADFIEVQTHVLWTDEFVEGRDVLEFTICADKVPVSYTHLDVYKRQNEYNGRRELQIQIAGWCRIPR